MNLLGFEVYHDFFGDGVVVAQADPFITVDFDGKQYKFEYQSSNSPFLKMMKAKNPQIQQYFCEAAEKKAREELEKLLDEVEKKNYIQEQKRIQIIKEREKIRKEKEKIRSERYCEKREHDRIYGLTPTSLALLGALDDFYDLYSKIVELYERELEKYYVKNTEEDFEKFVERDWDVYSDRNLTFYIFEKSGFYIKGRGFDFDKIRHDLRNEMTKLCRTVFLRHKSIFSENDSEFKFYRSSFDFQLLIFSSGYEGIFVKICSFRQFLSRVMYCIVCTISDRRYGGKMENECFIPVCWKK